MVLVTTVYLVSATAPQAQKVLDTFLPELLAAYPEELVVTLDGGEMSVNMPEPVIISGEKAFAVLKDLMIENLPESVEGVSEGTFSVPTNIAVFDSDGTIEDFTDKYDTFILVNKTNIITMSDTGLEVLPLSEAPDAALTKSEIRGFVDIGYRFNAYLPLILFGMFFLGMLFYFFVIRPIYLLIMSGIFMIVGNFKGLNWGYGDYYKVGLHTITLPLILDFLKTLSGLEIMFPFWFFVVNLLFGVAVIFGLGDSVGVGKEKDSSKN